MPMPSHQQQPAQQSQHYQNAKSQYESGTVNGIAQPVDPMASNVNIFDTLAAKNNPNLHQAPNTNQQGMPVGTELFAAPQAQPPAPTPNLNTNVQEGGSPMDKWLKPVDNGSQQGGEPKQQAEVPAPFKSIFEQSKIEDYHSLVANKDFTGDVFNEDVQAAFKEGDFSSMPSIINAAVQQGVAMAAFMSGKVVDKGLGSVFDNFQSAVLPNVLNDHQLNNMWQAPEFSDFSSPAMQPMVQMATAHVQGMYPNATPQEIQQKALELMQDYNKQLSMTNFNPTSTSGQPQAAEAPTMSDMERLFNL